MSVYKKLEQLSMTLPGRPWSGQLGLSISTAVGVAQLPSGACVEIELIAEVGDE